MKKIVSMAIIMITCLVITGLFTTLANELTVWHESKDVTFGTRSVALDLIWVNLNNPKINVSAVSAKDQVGSVDSLANIAKQQDDTDKRALAAINGTFFNAYSDLQPLGTVIDNGQVQHISNSGSVATFSVDNRFAAMPIYTAIEGSINDQWDWPNNWYAWNINHYYGSNDAILLFDGKYTGPKPAHDFTGIVVQNGIVSKIEKGTFEIPDNGFLILSKLPDMLSRFKVGDNVAYRFTSYLNKYDQTTKQGATLDLSNTQSALGAGPTLIKNGMIVLDAKKEGFTEDKILSTRAQRSLMGVSASNHLVMTSVANVTVYELAQIAKALNLVEAINLDGGASSGLYYNNEYIITPGRLVSNAFVVELWDQPKQQLIINNKTIYSDGVRSYLEVDGQLYINLKLLADQIDAKLTTDFTTGQTVVQQYQQSYLLSEQTKVELDGQQETLALYQPTEQSTLYISMKHAAALFNLQYVHQPEHARLTILATTFDNIVNSADVQYIIKQYQKAADLYEQALALQPNHRTTLKKVAQLYNKDLNDQTKALDYYARLMQIDNSDLQVINAYAWLSYGNGYMTQAKGAFNRYIECDPDSANGYYGLGLIYASYKINNKGMATDYFNIALTKKPTETQMKFINQYMAKR